MSLVLKMKNTDKPELPLFAKLLTEPGDKKLLDIVLSQTKVSFTLGFYSVTAKVAGTTKGTQSFGVNLPATVTSILKGEVDPYTLAACRSQVIDLLNTILEVSNIFIVADGKTASTTAPLQQEVPELKPLSQLLEDELAVASKPKSKPVPATKKVVKLREASYIGQKVYGTSAGSVYTVAAVSNRVKVAMRFNNNQLSVRAEGTPNIHERGALLGFGMGANVTSNGETYYSMHIPVQEVPVQRVVGAAIMGMGVEFESVITNAKEVL